MYIHIDLLFSTGEIT